MVQQQKPPEVRSTRSKVMVILRAAAWGAVLYELRYLRQLLVMVLSLPMIVLAMREPGSGLGYEPDGGDWACRIIFWSLFFVVNIGVLVLETTKRLRPYTFRGYRAAILLIVVGTLLAYVMRLIFIDH